MLAGSYPLLGLANDASDLTISEVAFLQLTRQQSAFESVAHLDPPHNADHDRSNNDDEYHRSQFKTCRG